MFTVNENAHFVASANVVQFYCLFSAIIFFYSPD